MTLEELEVEANAKGYKLTKITENNIITLEKCTCGHKGNPKLWYQSCDGRKVYECLKCGLRGEAAETREEAKQNWNDKVNAERSNANVL